MDAVAVSEIEVTDIEVVDESGVDGPRQAGVPQSVIATALAVTFLYGGMAQGGFHSAQFRILLVLVAITSAAAIAGRLRPRMGAWVPAAGFLGVSTLLSALSAQALSGALPTLGLLAAMTAVTCIVDRLDDAAAEQVFFGLGALGVLVAGSAWIGVAFHVDPLGRVADGLWRGSSTLTYSNAAASLVGAIVLMIAARAAGHVGDEHGGWRPSHTLLETLPLFVLTTGLLVTQSRGGLAATAVGGLILALRLGIVRMAGVMVVPGAAALFSAAVVLADSSVESDPRPVRSIIAAGLGLLIVALAPFVRARFGAPRSAHWRTLSGLVVAVAIVGGALGATFAGNSFSDIVERRLTLSSNTAAGEVVFFGDRSHEWKAALTEVQARPLLGVGPGQLQLRWQEDDGNQYSASFVHNEYLELAATHGLLGVVAALLGGALVIGELRHRRRAHARHVRWGGYAALITLLAHSALDYLWHLPLIPLVMAAIVGLLVRSNEKSDESTQPTSEDHI